MRHVFSANAYGDVAAVHKWRDQNRPESSKFVVAFFARSDAERAARELSPGSRDPAAAGVTVDFLDLDDAYRVRDGDLRDALDRLSLSSPPGRTAAAGWLQ